MREPLLAEEDLGLPARLLAYENDLMTVAVKSEAQQFGTPVTYCPQHPIHAEVVETIGGFNKQEQFFWWGVSGVLLLVLFIFFVLVVTINIII